MYRVVKVLRILNQFAMNDSFPVSDGLKHTIVSLLPFHMLDEPPSLYSLRDLERAKSGELLADLKLAIDLASSHVSSCEVIRLELIAFALFEKVS